MISMCLNMSANAYKEFQQILIELHMYFVETDEWCMDET